MDGAKTPEGVVGPMGRNGCAQEMRLPIRNIASDTCIGAAIFLFIYLFILGEEAAIWPDGGGQGAKGVARPPLGAQFFFKYIFFK
jgi:hypothetical protein